MHKISVKIHVYVLTVILLVSSLGVVINSASAETSSQSAFQAYSPLALNPVHATFLPNTSLQTAIGPFSGNISVMVTFRYSNFSELQNYLSNLSSPLSSQYHRYISSGTFDHLYGPSSRFYNSAVMYFEAAGNAKIRTFSDHVSIEITASSSFFNTAFHTNMTKYRTGNNWFYSIPTLPELPSWLSAHVSTVTGLSNYTTPKITGGSFSTSGTGTSGPSKSFGYPVPIAYQGTQYVWGSDFQVAYNEQKLLKAVYPVNVSIATILWSGNDSSGYTAPYYPQDVYTYFNETLATGQPIPKVYAVPLNGAVGPGISASYDTTSASFENTLDIEMVGSTAPGSNIYNVYTPQSTISSLDMCFAYILNANKSTNPGLANVSVISNSWYSGSVIDPTWTQYLMEAQALGITVLAASGDSGDNTSSSKYLGSNASFPGNAAYNNYGMVSVGGSSVVLSTSSSQSTFLTIQSQDAWYVKGPSSSSKTSVGTQGGIDQNLTEPSWQLNSVANNVIQGKGRGVPDIGAVANNTIMYMTVQGTSYYDNPNSEISWGTSIASPLEAGIIGEINAYLNHEGRNNVGFIDPALYSLGNLQYGTMKGNIISANYSFLNPFYDVTTGHNAVYSESYGYSLVTGLGSINAFNMTQDLLDNFTSVSVYSVSINILLKSSETITGIYINGQQLAWNYSSFNIFLSNGTYTYNITLKSNSGNFYSNGQFNVTGNSTTVNIGLSNQTGIPVPNLFGNHPLLFVLGFLFVLIILISFAFRRKKT